MKKKIFFCLILATAAYTTMLPQSAAPLLLLRRFLGPQSAQQWLSPTGGATPYTDSLNQSGVGFYSTTQPADRKKNEPPFSRRRADSLTETAFSLSQSNPAEAFDPLTMGISIATKASNRFEEKQNAGYSQEQQQRFEQQKKRSAWYSRAYNSWKNYWNRSDPMRSGTGLLGLAAGAVVYKKMEEGPMVAFAAEKPTFKVSLREMWNPPLLKKRIDDIPEEGKPQAAVDLVSYLATFLDGGKWESALSKAIDQFPELTSIIVNFLTEHPVYLAANAPEIANVLDFFYKKLDNPQVAPSIIKIGKTIQDTPELIDMPYGHAIITRYNKQFPADPVPSTEKLNASVFAPFLDTKKDEQQRLMDDDNDDDDNQPKSFSTGFPPPFQSEQAPGSRLME